MTVNLGLDEISVGEDGFRFTMVGGEDISGVSTVQIKFEKPDGSNQTVTGSVETAADGEFYVTVPSDLFDTAGSYAAQGICTFTSKTLKTRRVTFTVNPSL